MRLLRPALLACLSLSVALGASLLPAGASPTPAPAALEGVPAFGHVVVLTLENESASTSFAPTSPAHYLNSLRGHGVFLPNYYGTGHLSLDNYIAMVSGQPVEPHSAADCAGLSLYACVQPQGALAAGRHLGDQLDAAGVSWQSLMDGTTTPCFHAPYSPTSTAADPYQGNSTTAPGYNYADRHNPFLYFPDFVGNQARCAAHQKPFTDLAGQLAGNTLPRFTFITPDTCHDGHDTPCAQNTAAHPEPGGLVSADRWLSAQLPALVSYLARTNGLLVINFDEGSTSTAEVCPSCASGGLGGRTGAVLVSPRLPQGATVTVSFDHDSLLRSIEDMFGVSEHLNLAANATPMTAAFAGTRPFVAPPSGGDDGPGPDSGPDRD